MLHSIRLLREQKRKEMKESFEKSCPCKFRISSNSLSSARPKPQQGVLCVLGGRDSHWILKQKQKTYTDKYQCAYS